MENNNTEVTNGITGNDMMHISFSVSLPDDFNKEDELPSLMIFTNKSKVYAIKPSNNYLWCDYKTVPFRNVTGDTNKIINTLDKFFKKLHDSIVDDYNNNLLHDNYAELVKKKLNIK